MPKNIKKNTKKMSAMGGTPINSENLLNILAEAIGMDSDKLKKAIHEVSYDTADIIPYKRIDVNRKTDGKHYGVNSIKYSHTNKGIYYYEHEFINADGQYKTLKNSRVYLNNSVVIAEILNAIRWVITQQYTNKIPKEVKEAINDLHSLL